jgi:hypothetical protein
MTRRLLRITLIGLVAIVAFAGAWPGISTALGIKVTVNQDTEQQLNQAKSPLVGVCKETGVTLVIDYGISADKPEEVTCVRDFAGPGGDATSWDLFRLAKIQVEGTQQYPTGFVCRINNVPSMKEQDCTGTPTRKQGTWAYFYMAAGTKPVWRFAMQGSASRKPECGSVEGWVFSSSSAPLSKPRVTPKPISCVKQ